MGIKQKKQKAVTKDRAKYRCPHLLSLLIKQVNEIAEQTDQWWELIERTAPNAGDSLRSLCKGVHELAQFASLRIDMREDYKKAVVGTDEEWKRFCRSIGIDLWRKWPETSIWRWPRITIEWAINDEGIINTLEQDIWAALRGVDARRLRECRKCKRIFWAQWITTMDCDKRCGGAFRSKEFRENKKLADKDARQAKKP